MFTLRFLPNLIGQFSILPAVIISIIRFGKVSRTFYPFIYFLWTGLLAELASLAASRLYHTNAPVSNTYVLLEFLLLLWLFRNWGVFKKAVNLYRLLLFGVPLIWVTDILIVHGIAQFSSVYRLVYSLALVLLSIHYLNVLFFEETRSFLRNPRALISMALAVFFSFKALLEMYYVFQISNMKELFHWVTVLFDIVNLLANFTFAAAMLWVRKKDAFSLR